MASLKDHKAKGDVPPRAAKLHKHGKEAWAKEGGVFDVIGVTHHPEGDNGPYWTVEVDMLGETYAFDLQGHVARDGTMAVLAELIAVEPVTGCQLVALSKRAGNSFLVIDEAEEV